MLGKVFLRITWLVMTVNTCANVLSEACYSLMQNVLSFPGLIVNSKTGYLLQ